MDAEKPITVKLLIDTNENRVLFAEASKDFVDFLFFLLSLPIGTVIKLLAEKSIACSISNLYSSFADLKENYLEPNVDKAILLNPKASIPVAKVPLLMGTSTTSDGAAAADAATNLKVYLCTSCRSGVTNMRAASICPMCGTLDTMTEELPYYVAAGTAGDSSSSSSSNASYVQGVVSYMISDDLSVTPMSMISSISMMNKYNVSNLSVLQEKEVEVGTKEALELLKASLQSCTALTDVFLGSVVKMG